jgi:class 3 adenylate cyclase
MISEACASMGVRGNEELAFCINRYMEGMVKSLGKYGGDIIKFVGDAMIVMWPRIPENLFDAKRSESSISPIRNAQEESKSGSSPMNKDNHEDKVSIIRKAIQCALDI